MQGCLVGDHGTEADPDLGKVSGVQLQGDARSARVVILVQEEHLEELANDGRHPTLQGLDGVRADQGKLKPRLLTP